MSPRASPCDGVSGALPAYVDHELPEGQGAAVEAHLEGCPRCQSRLRELESVSAVLKAWDAQVPAGPPAPLRLERAVLARVEAASHERRARRRGQRVMLLALAASVLLAVGLPLALGLARRAAQVPNPPFILEIAEAPRAPAVQPPRAPGAVATAAELLTHVPWTPPPEPPVSQAAGSAEREAFVAGALSAQRELELERDFTLRVGLRGVWVTDQKDGVSQRLLVTPEAARAFAPDELLAWLRAKSSEPYYDPAEARPRPLGLSAGDLLAGVLRTGDGSRAWREERPAYSLGKPGTPRHLLDAWSLAVRGAAAPAGPELLDPLLAQERGLLRLEPSAHDVATLVAVVEGTSLPIFLPAGQLISGGETDLVVARATWLPATGRQDVWQIPAVVVRGRARRQAGVATLTPFVAGPSLRAMLLAGVDAEAVRLHARGLVAATLGGQAPAEWSLLDLYDGATDGKLLAQLLEVARAAPHGLVLADAQGRFLGLEHLTVRGEGAAPLLARLLHGFAWEAIRRPAASGAESPASASLVQVLERLVGGAETLTELPAPAGVAAPGVSRATTADASRAIEALRVAGERVSVSVLPR